MTSSSIVQVISCANRNDSLGVVIDLDLAEDLGLAGLVPVENDGQMFHPSACSCTIDNNLNASSL